ncbi:unnamed protein product [Zymoseptoria tritici ST99CH_3D1]|uniref:BTB domain-containing protein n=1 Tax=Zymoseptoria tritici ST99CH_1E4 TaxID=1276532 RepID=A0A2H1G6A5_ZYMTR|nr:unnamed protein product [Zymoseptoria tritici ST99CH_1E4]SMR50247.1 unnamed protein product [Zymoseptoria tritici ST99CH_3D1]
MSPEDCLKKGLSDLYTLGNFTDFTIKYGPCVANVHKAVICAQSAYFKIACDENGFKEGKISMITLDISDDPASDDVEAIGYLIHFFYHLDYEVKMRGADSGQTSQARIAPSMPGDSALAHAKVFAVAEKYQVPGLKELAVSKFKAAMEISQENADLAEIITTVFTTTPETVRDLRDLVSARLTTDCTLLDRIDVEFAVNNVSGLTFELLQEAHKAAAALQTARANWGPPTICRFCAVSPASRCYSCRKA